MLCPTAAAAAPGAPAGDATTPVTASQGPADAPVRSPSPSPAPVLASPAPKVTQAPIAAAPNATDAEAEGRLFERLLELLNR